MAFKLHCLVFIYCFNSVFSYPPSRTEKENVIYIENIGKIVAPSDRFTGKAIESMKKAFESIREKDYKKGIENIADAIINDAYSYDYQWLTGVCYLQLGDLLKAQVDLTKAVEREKSKSPRDYELLTTINFFLVEVYLSAKNYEAAERIMKIEIIYPSVYTLGDNLCAKKKFKEAMFCYNQTMLLYSEEAGKGYFSRGNCYAKMGDMELSKINMQLAVASEQPELEDKAFSGAVKALFTVALFNAQLFEQAKKEMIDLDENDHETVVKRLVEDKKHSDKVIDFISKIIDEYPKNSVFHEKRGQYFLELNRLEEAIEDFREAVRLGPSVVNYRISLIQLLLSAKEYSEAETAVNDLDAQVIRLSRSDLTSVEKMRKKIIQWQMSQ